jgi:hypothetical protein
MQRISSEFAYINNRHLFSNLVNLWWSGRPLQRKISPPLQKTDASFPAPALRKILLTNADMRLEMSGK